MTLADSVELARSLDERADRDEERKKNLRQKISELIRRAAEIDGAIPRLLEEDDEEEYRVEAYDISNTSGFASVGSMVVYERGKPKRNDYRKFRIKASRGRTITPAWKRC
mgnify:CR=1 FL=1